MVKKRRGAETKYCTLQMHIIEKINVDDQGVLRIGSG